MNSIAVETGEMDIYGIRIKLFFARKSWGRKFLNFLFLNVLIIAKNIDSIKTAGRISFILLFDFLFIDFVKFYILFLY